MKFVLNKKYYPQPTYEFNLPVGHTCPFAKECKVKVDRYSGKFESTGTRFRCYASSSERFPAVRKHRWSNLDDVLNDKPIVVPEDATHVRIHASGDFFSQIYFDQWLEVARVNPTVQFWAFTKSLMYWIARLNNIPSNLNLTASYGGLEDYLIEEYSLKYAKVFTTKEEFIDSGLPLDTDDSLAMKGDVSFALLDNHKFKKKGVSK